MMFALAITNRGWRLGLALLGAGLLGWGGARAADTTNVNHAAAEDAVADDVDWSRHVVEAYRDYQQQQEQTIRALETAREEAAAAATAAREKAVQLETRLARIEGELQAQREQELAALAQSHRTTVRVIGGLAVMGFLGIALIAWVLYRAMTRRVEQVTAGLARMPVAGLLGNGEQTLASQNPAAQSTARFLSAIERLEKRLADMEDDVALPITAMPDAPPTTEPAGSRPRAAVPAAEEPPSRVAVLLAKGQSLCNLDKHAEALACFEEVLALEPDNPEALVRKGSVLEAQDQIDAALEHYDRALTLDDSLTMAYLRKGGVYNRLERYGEALECYEKALRSQQKSHLAEINT